MRAFATVLLLASVIVPAAASTAPAVRATAPAAAAAAAIPMTPERVIAILEDRRRWDATLEGALNDRDPVLRARAALAVGRMQDSTAAQSLLPLFADREAVVRRQAAFALGLIGSRAAREALQMGLEDEDAEVADLSLEALGKLGDPAATPRVTAMLDAASPRLRADAAMALWRLADTTAASTLIAHLGDADPEVRWHAAYALEKLPLPLRIVPAVVPLLADPDPLVRAYAARTLGRERSRKATEPLIMIALLDREPAVRINAIRSLQQIADSIDARVPSALRAQLVHPDPYVRVTAATALAEGFAWMSDSLPTSEALRRRLADPDAATRGACARALIMRQGADGLAASTTVLADSSVFARVGALDGLRQRGDATLALAPLTASIARGRPLFERMTAAEITGVLAGKGGREALASLLPLLRAGVLDRDVLLAASCAGALGDWGDSASVRLLTSQYALRGKDADADARIAIRDALRALAGRAFADSVERAHPPADTLPATYAADFADPPTERGAIIHTRQGDIEWEFFGADAPQTVRNFVRLAKRGYFDGQRVHRVVPNFVIQSGDPTGTGSGGPGWTIRCEYNRRRYAPGMVGMALSGKDTGGSQWFITHSPQPHLDGRYTIFARVTRGMDVVWRITQGDRIDRVEILESSGR